MTTRKSHPMGGMSNQNDETTTSIPPSTLQRRTQSKARQHIVCHIYNPRGEPRVYRGARVQARSV